MKLLNPILIVHDGYKSYPFSWLGNVRIAGALITIKEIAVVGEEVERRKNR